MKTEMERRMERSSQRRDRQPSDSNDIVVKVVCKYRAELFFKISRKTKLSRLFNAWTDRMESAGGAGGGGGTSKEKDKSGAGAGPAAGNKPGMEFIFTYLGRSVDAEQTPEELGIEDGDEILAVEMMDLTKDAVRIGHGHFASLASSSDALPKDEVPPPQQQRLKKNWNENPQE